MQIELLIGSAIAGILTVLSPCVAPILPVILAKGGDGDSSRARNIIVSLSLSVIVFTLLLRSSLDFLDLSFTTLERIAAGILVAVGLSLIFPMAYERLSVKLYNKSQSNLARAQKFDNHSDVLTGIALGPVFTSCSPTFAVIISILLTSSLVQGTVYLVIYTAFLALALFMIAIYGQVLIRKLGFALNPDGSFRKIAGVLLVLVGLAVFFGWDAQIETWLLERGLYEPISEFENNIIEQ